VKKSFFSIVLSVILLFTLSIGVAGASDDLATEAPGRTFLIDKVKADSIEGTGAFANEEAVNLFDDDPATKFCTNIFPAVVTWQMDKAYVVDAVVICTANDNASYPGRNPETWTFSGSNDGTNYTVIYEGKASDLDDVDFTYFLFTFNNSTAYSHYKLEIPGPESGTVMQISEFILCEKTSAGIASEDYPSSGQKPSNGDIILGDLIGNEIGWGDNPDAGRHAAFDGDVTTFFDPLGLGDGYCGIDAGQEYILTQIVIHPRDGFLDRYYGAEIQGSNDMENWTTLYFADDQAADWDWQVIAEADIQNNTGYRYFRYYNEVMHGDVAEVELYGYPVAGEAASAPAEEAPSEPVEEVPAPDAASPATSDMMTLAVASIALAGALGFVSYKKRRSI
jgi:hypothetical protein